MTWIGRLVLVAAAVGAPSPPFGRTRPRLYRRRMDRPCPRPRGSRRDLDGRCRWARWSALGLHEGCSAIGGFVVDLRTAETRIRDGVRCILAGAAVNK
jgi:hypothetical protein